jgi:hypothetical protein
MNKGICDNWDNTTSFFVENAICFSDVNIFGDLDLGKGQDFEISLYYNNCTSDCSGDR